jgi:2-polyprenyl-3-methyl-5-hydroxy-6-metoxy-1,4-benzoquinol methylase
MSLFDTAGFGLEVGPGFNPLLPKSEGYNVETLDHLCSDDLVLKYQNAPGVKASSFEPIDYISSGSAMFDAIGVEDRFDFIVASHVIEHSADFIGFLRDAQRLLKTDGILVLAVPDKRFSFDVLRPLASTGDVMQAHLERRIRHTPGAIFDEVAYNALRGNDLAWSRKNSTGLSFFSNLEKAKNLFEAAQHDLVYHDIHAWQFTPSSFRLILNDLYEIGYIKLREKIFHEVEGEFYVVLSHTGLGPLTSRLRLAEQSIDEQRTIMINNSRRPRKKSFLKRWAYLWRR